METNKNSTPLFYNFLIPAIVSLSVFGLFYLDYEIKSIADLFTLENLIAFAVYFVPTLLLCYLLYHVFLKRNDRKKSMIKALLVGIPSGFVIVIGFLLMVMNR